jgi:hypothetical protein
MTIKMKNNRIIKNNINRHLKLTLNRRKLLNLQKKIKGLTINISAKRILIGSEIIMILDRMSLIKIT